MISKKEKLYYTKALKSLPEHKKISQETRLKKMVEMSDFEAGDSVLDVGCGTKEIKKYLPNADYVGVDMIDDADVKHNLERGLPKQVKNKKFDIVFMGEFLEHVENFKSLVEECSKIIGDGGRIIISVPYAHRFQVNEEKTHIHSFNDRNIKNLADMCGLKVISKMGTFIHIPVLHLNIPSNQTIYTNNVIYRLEKK